MIAKYYIYWNLHKDCYSVKYRGRVIMHAENLIVIGVTFKVSEKGRARVLKEKRKNVHAYVMANKVFSNQDPYSFIELNYTENVTYNPYKYSTFVDSQEKPIYHADMVWLTKENNKASLKVCK